VKSCLSQGIDSQISVDLGHQLKSARKSKNLSIKIVSKALVLTEIQVNGLEMGEFSSFYTPDFYVRALKKYAAFLGLPLDISLLSDLLLEMPAISLYERLGKKLGLRSSRSNQFKVGNSSAYEILFFKISKRLFKIVILMMLSFFVLWGYIQSERKAAEGKPIDRHQEEVDKRAPLISHAGN
jgi:cytoskeletal protein RodZ